MQRLQQFQNMLSRLIFCLFRCTGQAGKSHDGEPTTDVGKCRLRPTACGFGAPAVSRPRALRLLPRVHGPVAPSERGTVARLAICFLRNSFAN